MTPVFKIEAPARQLRAQNFLNQISNDFIQSSNNMGTIKVLMVAEKPSLAKAIAEHLSNGKVGADCASMERPT